MDYISLRIVHVCTKVGEAAFLALADFKARGLGRAADRETDLQVSREVCSYRVALGFGRIAAS